MSSENERDEDVQRGAESHDEPTAETNGDDQPAYDSMTDRVHHWTAVSRRVRRY